MNKTFRSTCDRIIQQVFEALPFLATASGSAVAIERLADLSSGGVSKTRALLEEAREALAGVNQDNLTAAEQVDFGLLSGFVRLQAKHEPGLMLNQRNAYYHVAQLSDALLGTVAVEELSKSARANALATKLEALPAWLLTVKQHLAGGYDVPAVWTQAGIDALDGLDKAFQTVLLPFAHASGAGEAVADIVEGSRRMLTDLRTFLTDRLLPEADGAFAIGRAHYELMLSLGYGVPIKAVSLLEGTQARVDAALTAVEEALAELGTRSLRKGVEQLTARTPALGKTDKAYERQIERFTAWAKKIGLPSIDPIAVEPVPPFLHRSIARLAVRPLQLQGRVKPVLWINPIDKSTPEHEREDRLAEHAVPAVQGAAARYGMPGTALLTAIAGKGTSRVRRLCGSAATAEGWGIFAAESMVKLGVIKEPKARFAVARDRLIQAVLHEIDVRVHLRLMSVEEGTERLQKLCRMPRGAAELTMNELIIRPAFATAAQLGYEAIRDLAAGMAQPGEAGFAKFAKKVLPHGLLPPAQLTAQLRS
ncbi:MAG: DUF885 family protein [Planctomycetota bacterium]|jgi:uncharacterized protein (DUF885 family)